ncbi:hypothetical protein BDZ45DRAFT_754637 [Acephala macrosclerotiorum]|nr:hypothetical protein BDZ45DRAFT_754637 [Acephala macrosclerotiorum]
MASSNFLIQSTSSIPLPLVATASAEVDSGAQAPAKAEAYLELAWSPSCQKILEVYVKEHYTKISADSPEYEIIKPPEVKKTGGKVFKLLGGQTYGLPGGSSSAYVAIPLTSTGHPTVEVIDLNQKATPIPWNQGSLVYLTGTSGLKCCGHGTVVCIMLAMAYGIQ